MNCDTHYGRRPAENLFVWKRIKHVRSTWYDGLQVNIFDTSERSFNPPSFKFILNRQQNEPNSAFVKDATFLFFLNEPDVHVNLSMNNFYSNELWWKLK